MEDDKAAPVVSKIVARMVIILILTAFLMAILLDIKGAFLNGRFQRGKVLFMKVLKEFKKCYPRNILLRLLRTIYGLK